MFGDMENGWKKSFRPPPKDENSGTTARHARAVITLIITHYHVYLCRDQSDRLRLFSYLPERYRSMAGQIASQRSAHLLGFARTLSVFKERSGSLVTSLKTKSEGFKV